VNRWKANDKILIARSVRLSESRPGVDYCRPGPTCLLHWAVRRFLVDSNLIYEANAMASAEPLNYLNASYSLPLNCMVLIVVTIRC